MKNNTFYIGQAVKPRPEVRSEVTLLVVLAIVVISYLFI